MAHVKRSVLVPHSAEKMYTLVEKVEDYPKFLPWCGGSRVEDRTDQGMIASVDIDFKGLKQTFTTINQHHPFSEIQLALIKGPFSQLRGAWKFIPLGNDACEVQFDLNYTFASGLLGPLLTPIFDAIAGSFIDAFVVRAEALYGS
jgi:ribosome-associated toxin RatA of RatAB toxin-antitoxin module